MARLTDPQRAYMLGQLVAKAAFPEIWKNTANPQLSPDQFADVIRSAADGYAYSLGLKIDVDTIGASRDPLPLARRIYDMIRPMHDEHVASCFNLGLWFVLYVSAFGTYPLEITGATESLADGFRQHFIRFANSTNISLDYYQSVFRAVKNAGEPDADAAVLRIAEETAEVVLRALRYTSADRPSERMGESNSKQPVGYAFISYVREDAADVDQLQHDLEFAGVSVWRDTADIWPGEEWRRSVRKAITNDALAFIVCFSHQSLARSGSYQNEELMLAIEQLRRRPLDVPWLIPVRFDDCLVPDIDLGAGRSLRSIQRADLFGDARTTEAVRLIATVQRLLGKQDPGFRAHQ